MESTRFSFEDDEGAGGITLIANANGFSTVSAINDAGTGLLVFDSDTLDANYLIADVGALNPTGPQSWNLITMDVLSRDDDGQTFEIMQVLNADNPDNWSFSVIDPTQDARGAITLSYIPEPASLALLGVGGSLALLRRRA